MWEIEYIDEFEDYWRSLSGDEQARVSASIELLETIGPTLGRPHVDSVNQYSRHSNMKELRVQCDGLPIRILFAFDPRRTGILLVGGNKAGNSRWYRENITLADELYDNYLEELRKENLING